jgi:hypothetical protein
MLIQHDSLGATPSKGDNNLYLVNTAAAANGAQQGSPQIVWEGQGWKTNSTAASQEVQFRAYVLPVQGTANPSATWTLQSSINGGAFGNSLTYTSGGVLNAAATVSAGGSSSIDSGGSVNAASSGSIRWTSQARMTSPSDGIITLLNNGSTAFTRLNFGGTTSSFGAIQSSGTTLTAGLADGSAGGVFNASGILANSGGLKRVTSQFDKTNTTLADVTGLSVTVAASTSYRFKAVLYVDTDAVGGHKYAIAGTATATNVIYQVNSINNGSNAFRINSRQTALGGAGVGEAVGTAYYTEITGTIAVNAGGTLTVQFAQNAANGTSSVLVGSYFEVMGF